MSLLVERLDEAANHGCGRYRHLPGPARPHDLAELWDRAGDAARWFVHHVGTGGTAAAVLTSTPASIVVLVGALRAGVRLLSLPLPAHSDPIERYGQFVCSMSLDHDATHLLVDDRYRAAAEMLPLTVTSFDDCTSTGVALPATADPTLVQFTSGSTSAPKGVVLTGDAIARHLEALLGVLDPRPGETACSWLPLSHDMGLFGLTLAPWLAASPRWSGRGQLVLIDSLAYARRPAIWMQACSRYEASVTAAPPRAYRSAARQLERDPQVRLDALRVAIVGAEPIPPDWLRAFDAAAQLRGAPSTSLCPGYGLAEATLAVTMVDPGAEWATASFDQTDGHPCDLVGVGRPIPGTEIRTGRPSSDDHSEPGTISFRSPHRFLGYLGAGASGQCDATQWHDTHDLGIIDERGELYVIGRTDDVIIVNGHNLHPEDVETSLVTGFSPLDVTAAVGNDTAGLDVVLEIGGDERDRPDGRSVRRHLRDTVGVNPARVLRAPSGTLPRTPSGKVRRREIRRLLEQGELDVVEL